MKREIGLKLIEALRSGKYIQGINMLHNLRENSYCCLGVLCAVAGADFEIPDYFADAAKGKSEPVLIVNKERVFLREQSDQMLNYEFAEKNFGLSYADQKALAKMNDGEFVSDAKTFEPVRTNQKSFKEIADFIETELLEAA